MSAGVVCLLTASTYSAGRLGAATLTSKLESLGTIRGRVGLNEGCWYPYVTGGLALARRTGLPRDEVIAQLAKMLPNVVDQMTPEGRLPTQRAMERLLG